MACPAWDLGKILSAAKEFGYDGVELRGLGGELNLPLSPELASDPAETRRRFQEAGVELVSLGSSATLTSRQPRELGKAKSEVVEYLELAVKLGCPSVRIMAGESPSGENREATLVRIGQALTDLSGVISRLGVRLLIENGGDFQSSSDLWFLSDFAGHPLIRCCWNQCHAMALHERKTNSLPRLGSRLGLVHICDGRFDNDGVLQGYCPLGEGDIDVARQIEILKGLVYDEYLVFEWPRIWVESLAGPETTLPAAAKFMRNCIESKQPILSAYKGDKNAPKLAAKRRIPAAG